MNRKDLKELPLVDVISSGYEWVCPQCGKLNNEIEYKEHYLCTCGQEVKTDLPEHTYG